MIDDFLLSAFGTSDAVEAARLLEAERLGMMELRESNIRLARQIKALGDLLSLAAIIMTGVEDYGGMFLDASTRKRIEKYRSLLRAYEEKEKKTGS